MAVRKKSSESSVNRVESPSSRNALPPPITFADTTSSIHVDFTNIEFLNAERAKQVCSPELTNLLKNRPGESLEEEVELSLALLAIKFDIEKEAWVLRALEKSTSIRTTIETLIATGLRNSLAVAHAIVKVIISHDYEEEWDPLFSSEVILYLQDQLVVLFENEDSRVASVLDRIAEMESTNAVFRETVDAILKRDSPGAAARRNRWFSDSTAYTASISPQIDQLNNSHFNVICVANEYANALIDLEGRIAGLEMGEELEEKEQKEPTGHSINETRKSALSTLLATVSGDTDYSQQSRGFAELSHNFRREIAARLEPILNAHIQAMPQETYEEKKTLAKWVNAEVERFGLTVKCPKTGLPATLRTHSGNWPGIGRFTFEVYIDGTRKTPAASDRLPELQLIDVTLSQGSERLGIESERPWQNAVGPKTTRRGHKRS